MPRAEKIGMTLDRFDEFKRHHAYDGMEPPVKDGWWYSVYTNTVEYWKSCPETNQEVFEQYHISPSIKDRHIHHYFKRRIGTVPFSIA